MAQTKSTTNIQKSKPGRSGQPQSGEPRQADRPGQRLSHRWRGTLPARLWRRLTRRTPHNPHRPFRLTTQQQRQLLARDMRGAWALLRETTLFIKHHYRILLGLGLIYAVLNCILVGGITQLDYAQMKEQVSNLVGGQLGTLPMAAAFFGLSFVGALDKPATELQQFLGGILTLLFWLAIVWATRMLMAGKRIAIRDALYTSGTPFISSILILLLITLQIIPLVLGVAVYAFALPGGLPQSGIESLVFAVAVLLLGLLSLYWVTGSFIAGIIVALPGMYPMRAVREAKDLVAGRRWGVTLRLLVLLLVMFIIWALVMIPVFMLDGWLRLTYLPLVPIFTQLLGGLTLTAASVYIYKTYRSLL